MSITDELREWMYGHTVNCSDNRIALVAIADRIDATYEEDVNTACKLANSLSADELDERGWIIATDENMAEHGWVRLPLDADGVPIRVGDEMEPISVKYDRFGVVTLCLDTRDGRWSLLTDLDGEWSYDEMCQLRHYHAPKVEDVLREFASDIADVLGGDDFRLDGSDELFAEYAAKLRLAGDDE